MALNLDKLKEKVEYVIYKQYNSSNATTAANVWKPSGSRRFILSDMFISTDTAGTITIYDGGETLLIVYLAANGGVVLNFDTPLMSKNVNNILKAKHSAAGNINVTTNGYEMK